MASSLSGSFSQIETGASQIDEGLGALLQQLTGVGGVAEAVSTELSSVGQAAVASLAGVDQLSTASKQAEESEVELAGVLDFLVHGLTVAGQAMEHLGVEAAGELTKGLEEIIGPLTTSSALAPTLQAALNGIASAINSVVPGLSSAGQALSGVATGIGEVATAASAASGPISSLEGISATAPALTSVSAGMQEVGTSLTGLGTEISGVTTGLDDLLASLMAVGEAGDMVAGSFNVANASIAGAVAPLADETGQLLLFTQAAADATGQLLLFETVASETVAAEQAQAAAQTEAAASLAQYNVTLGEGVVQSATLAKAIAVLNQELAKGVVNQEAIASASGAVAAAAQKAGLSVVQTATGMKILSASTKEVEEEFTHLDGLMAMVSARAGAVMAGVGQLGFGLGMLARSLPSIGTLFVYAFPVIAVGLMAEVIQSIIDKIRKADDEIRKTAVAFDDLAAGAQASANSLALQNLKLEDQIAKLEGRPVTNHLKEALLEATIQADKLAGALSKDIEKSIELMEKADVSFFKSLYTGQAATSTAFGFGDDLKKAKDSLADYQLAVEKARSTQIDYEQSHTDAAKAAKESASIELENQKKVTEGVIQQLQRETNERIRKRADELAESYKAVGRAYPGGVGTPPPAGVDKEAFFRAEAAKQAAREFRQETQAVYETNSALKAFDITAAASAEYQKNLEKEAKDQIAVDKFNRGKLLEDPGIKAREEAGIREAAVMRASAASLLSQQEEQIKLEAVNAQVGGTAKEVAEEEAAKRIQEVRADHTQRMLMAQDKEFEARKAALQEEIALAEKDPNEGKRIAALTTLHAKLQQLEKDNQAKLADIAEKGGTDLIAAELNAAKARLEARKKVDQDLINETRNATRDVLEASRSDVEDEIRGAKDVAEQKLRIVQDEEQLGIITHKQALAQRLAFLEEENVATRAAYENRISILRTEQAEIERLINANSGNRELIKSLTDIYNQLETEIRRTADAEDKLSDSISRTKIDDQINQWFKAKAVIADFTNSATGAFENFAESVFTRNQSIKQDFFQLTIELERDFIRMIANMITQTALFNTIRSHIQGAIGKIFGVPSVAPGGSVAGAAGGVASTTGRVSETTALNANVVSLGAFGAAVNAATVSLGGHIPAVTASTVSHVGNTAAVHGSSTAHGFHVLAVLHSTGAHFSHALAVMGSTIAHIFHRVAIFLSSLVHGFHQATVAATDAVTVAHTAAVVNDTIATIIHAAVSMATLGAQTGGLIQGPGTGTSDSIFMRVSHGEYIVRASSVSQPGTLQLLQAINRGDPLPQKLIAAQGLDFKMQQLSLGSNISTSNSQQTNSPFSLNYYAGDTQALDGEGVGSVLGKHPDQLAKLVTGLVRSGRIKPSDILRR